MDKLGMRNILPDKEVFVVIFEVCHMVWRMCVKSHYVSVFI